MAISTLTYPDDLLLIPTTEDSVSIGYRTPLEFIGTLIEVLHSFFMLSPNLHLFFVHRNTNMYSFQLSPCLWKHTMQWNHLSGNKLHSPQKRLLTLCFTAKFMPVIESPWWRRKGRVLGIIERDNLNFERWEIAISGPQSQSMLNKSPVTLIQIHPM